MRMTRDAEPWCVAREGTILVSRSTAGNDERTTNEKEQRERNYAN